MTSRKVIIQPVADNDRREGGSPSLDALRPTVAMTRWALPPEVAAQTPPNLAPVRDLLDCGVDDIGGVSPVTAYQATLDYAWPALDELEAIVDEAGARYRRTLDGSIPAG